MLRESMESGIGQVGSETVREESSKAPSLWLRWNGSETPSLLLRCILSSDAGRVQSPYLSQVEPGETPPAAAPFGLDVDSSFVSMGPNFTVTHRRTHRHQSHNTHTLPPPTHCRCRVKLLRLWGSFPCARSAECSRRSVDCDEHSESARAAARELVWKR